MLPEINKSLPPASGDRAEVKTARGIERVPVDNLHWSRLRYRRLREAVAAAWPGQVALATGGMFDLVHQLLGTHVPDPARNHWDRGHFASVCIRCGREMVRLPGLPWRPGRTE